MKEPRLHDAFAKLLGQRLSKYQKPDTKLNLLTCTQIYEDIFNTLVEILGNANVKVTNESMNYLAQQYYDGVLINGRYELDPNIFKKRASLENIDTKEIALMAVMMNGTDFAVPLILEVRRRS